MAFLNPIEAYVRLTPTRSARAMGLGLIAFVVILGLDLLFHFAHWNWLWERLVCDSLEAALLVLIVLQIGLHRAALKQRHERQMGYLNHHVRNALAVITMAEQLLTDAKTRTSLVSQASREICSVIDQVSRDEEVATDKQNPESIGWEQGAGLGGSQTAQTG